MHLKFTDCLHSFSPFYRVDAFHSYELDRRGTQSVRFRWEKVFLPKMRLSDSFNQIIKLWVDVNLKYGQQAFESFRLVNEFGTCLTRQCLIFFSAMKVMANELGTRSPTRTRKAPSMLMRDNMSSACCRLQVPWNQGYVKNIDFKQWIATRKSWTNFYFVF